MENWRELIVQGSENLLRAFVAGFRAGSGARDDVVFGADVAIEPESIGERLKALFVAGSHHAFFASEPFARRLAEAVAAQGGAVGLRVERERVIESAAFPFRIEVYSRELACEARMLLVEQLPEGVRVEDLSEKEETHPDAVGPEPFAPLHAFIYRGSGRIVGPFGPVFRMWQRACERELSEIGRLSLTGNTVG